MSMESPHSALLLTAISFALLSIGWLKGFFQRRLQPESWKETTDPFKTKPTEIQDTASEPPVESQMAPQGISLGTLLNGRYLIKEELGSGGFGVVYLAEDQKVMNKLVVIKCPLEKFQQGKNYAWFEKKFNMEQEALVRIKHPNVVEVTEMGQAPNGKPFFVMEYVHGKSLQKVLTSGKLDVKRMVAIMAQACKAVSAAHDKGVLHCDLKPANIMLQSLGGGEEHVKVIDFGIAKITDSQFTRTDDPTKLAGTYGYMAPEQFEGRVYKASDIYALGVIAYQMATGLPPINSGSLIFKDYDVRLQIAESHLAHMRSDFSERAREVILKAIARKPEDRYAEARDFGSELTRVLRDDSAPKPTALRRVALLYKCDAEPDNRVLMMLEAGLKAHGCRVFVDRHLAVGMEWAKEIERQIRASDAVIALISAASVASEMLAYEVEIAHQAAQEQAGRPRILPVRLNYEEPLTDTLGIILEPLQYTLWQNPDDDQRIVEELIESLQTPFEYKPSKLPKISETVVGAVPLDSQFYIVRPTDREFMAAVAQHDSIVLIKGGRQMGKTSLLARGLEEARAAGSKVVLTDLQKLNATHLKSPETLFKALGEMIADQLDLTVLPEEIWNERRGASINFERYIKREVLSKFSQSLVWGMDEADRLFTCDFASEVFGLFRSWHNERQLDPQGPWKRLTLAIVYATEAHLFITNLDQSPFNVGTRLALSDFTIEQVVELNRHYGSPLRNKDEIARFYQLLSGQPFLVRRGLQELAAHKIKFDRFEQSADRDDGAFGDHLRRLLVLLAQDAALSTAMRDTIHKGAHPSNDIFYRLRSAGILKGGSAQTAEVRCQLYTSYFAKHL